MYRMLVLYSPPTDPEQFREHYVQTHIPLVRKVPGVLDARYSLEIGRFGGDPPYFCIAELDFESRGSMNTALRSDEGKAMAGDVRNFDTGGSIVLHYAVSE